MDPYVIGIDLGGTQIKFVEATLEGAVIRRAVRNTGDTPGSGMNTWASAIESEVARIQAERGPARSVGLSAPGLASGDRESIAFMPGRMQGLEDLNWRERLGAPVRVLNDAHAALMGEVWVGAARGLSHACLLTLGTGVGGAILSGGKLMRGSTGRAGHLGHFSLNPWGKGDITGCPGSLEDAIGECTLLERSEGKFTRTRDLVQAAQEGDPFASRVWLNSVRSLAAGVASLINVLDPEAVVIGGGISQAGEALFDPLAVYLEEMEWRPGGHQVRIVQAELGPYAGAIGAAYYGFAE